MATPAQIRAAIDARLAALWPTLVTRQNTYAASHGGRFWQGLRTNSTPPADGADGTGDRLTDRPYYQSEDWAAMGVSSWVEAFSLEVTQYVGPLGNGWVATATVTLGGRTFCRSKGQGPESRDAGWAEVTPPA